MSGGLLLYWQQTPRGAGWFCPRLPHLSESAEVLYKASGYWSKSCECSLRWNEPDLAIAWPLDRFGGVAPLLADKDAAAPILAEAVAAGEVFA